MPKYKRIAGVSFGDRHGGLKNGLIMPGTKLTYGVGEATEELEVTLSEWSDWLWNEVWEPGIEKAIEWAGSDPLIAADSGDAVHGSRFIENLYSPHVSHQIHISHLALTPLRKAPTLSAYYLAFGTAAHDYGSNSAAVLLAEKLANWGWYPKTDDHLRVMLQDDFLFDLSHHGPSVSQKPHLRENSARMYVREKVQEAVEWGAVYPRLFQRGHVHLHTDTPVKFKFGPNLHKSHIIITPPLCGPNGYARQAARSMQFVECGMYFWEIIDGQLGRVEPFIKSKDTRKTYKIDNDGMIFFNNMITDGGHKKHKKGKK